MCHVPGGRGKPLRKTDSSSVSRVSVSNGNDNLFLFVVVCVELMSITMENGVCVCVCVCAGMQSVSTSVQRAVTLSAGELPVEEILIQQVIESGERKNRSTMD